MQTRQIHLKRRPEGLPVRDDFALVSTDLPDLTAGQVLVRNRYISVDPYMRGRMRDSASYAAPFATGAPLDGHSVGEVVASADPNYAEGDAVTGFVNKGFVVGIFLPIAGRRGVVRRLSRDIHGQRAVINVN